jgi:hypothetical protein
MRIAWAVVVALAATIWAPTAGAEPPAPPAPPPPVEQQADEDDQARQDAQPQQESRQRATTSPVVRDGKQPISKIRYVLGGLAGTYYGFGIGHAIVGEWSNKGWIFTVGEIGSFVVIGAGLAQALPRNATDLERRRGGTIALAGAVAWSAFRFYEIYDVWTRPKVASVNKPVDTAFAVGPVGQEGGFGALLRLRW